MYFRDHIYTADSGFICCGLGHGHERQNRTETRVVR